MNKLMYNLVTWPNWSMPLIESIFFLQGNKINYINSQVFTSTVFESEKYFLKSRK